MLFLGFLLFVATLHLSFQSERLFDGNFRPPLPPEIVAEYEASFVQHKWDRTGISNIASGMIYANIALLRLRMDLTHGGVVASSLFDYNRTNIDGTIPNYM